MLKFEHPSNGRFYYLIIKRDILNDLILLSIYGGKNISRSRIIMTNDNQSIQKEIERLTKRRLAHGYILVA
jgi:hypothetical protein